jgi:hypothetical protein
MAAEITAALTMVAETMGADTAVETMAAQSTAVETMAVDTIAAKPTSLAGMRQASPSVLRQLRAQAERRILPMEISLDPRRVPLA